MDAQPVIDIRSVCKLAYAPYVNQGTHAARRTRAEMIEATRARLLAAARGAFAARGYAQTSMDDFTGEAGLTRGALYHHFGSKEGLLAAVIEQIEAEVGERLRAVSGAAPTPWEGFRRRCAPTWN